MFLSKKVTRSRLLADSHGVLSGMEWEVLEAIEPGDLFRGRCTSQSKSCWKAIPKQWDSVEEKKRN